MAFSLSATSVANETLIGLDCDRYVYFDGNFWVYVWLSDKDTRVNFILKSIYRPEKYGYKMIEKYKTVEGAVEVGAKVIENKDGK